MRLARGLSSKLIMAELEADYSSVRASVRLSTSSGKLKTYGFAPYWLKIQKIIYVFHSTQLLSLSKHSISTFLAIRLGGKKA